MLRPFITIEKQAQEVLDFYKSVFPNFSLHSLKYHADPHSDLIMLAVFSIKNQEIMISDTYISHDWKITPGISFFIDLDKEEELQILTDLLGKNGKVHMPVANYGFSTLFSWIEDQFGVNWQLNIE